MILIDTNVIIDLVDKHSSWKDWSQRATENAAMTDALCINHIILAELHGRPDTARHFAKLRAGLRIAIEPLDEETARRAGQAFELYRSRRGQHSSILADFLIGAHAVTLDATMLTRDAARFASYFPELTLITPETMP